MRNLKSVLAVIITICLMMCLAVPALATETTTAATEAEATTAATEAEATTAATEAEATTAATEEALPEENAEITTVVEGEEEHDHTEDVLTTGTDDIAYEEAETGFTKVLRVILLVLEVITSVALIVVVLLQTGKEAGLSGALTGNSDSYMSKSGKTLDKTLASITKWIALAWILVTLALALI